MESDLDFNLETSGAIAGWGDLDNDGLLDIVNLETAACKFYRNMRNGSFQEMASVANTGFTDVELQDFDADGYIDVAIVKSASPVFSVSILTNDGSWGFAETDVIALTASADVIKGADYDNDGRIDLAVGGPSYLEVLRNTPAGFVIVPTAVPGERQFRWVDYDTDGDMDIAVCRSDAVQLYRNNGDGTFSAAESISLPYTANVILGTAWIDMNCDGKMDVTVYGYDGAGACGHLHVLKQGATLSDWTTETGPTMYVTPTYAASASPYMLSWGDIQQRGYPALVVVDAGGGFAFIVNLDGQLNTPGMVFFGDELHTYCHCVDYNIDGQLDIHCDSALYYFTAGWFGSSPSPPSNLQSAIAGGGVTVSWNAATDAETPSAGLTYNVRVRSESGGTDDIVPCHSDPVTGKRRIPAMGNVQLNTSWTLKGLASGTYYWSVQAVDNGYVGSTWAVEQSFIIP